jgi:hypothetical protein
MPFNQPLPRSFREISVRQDAPVNNPEWISIGKRDDIQHALLEHLQVMNSRLFGEGQRNLYTRFVIGGNERHAKTNSFFDMNPDVTIIGLGEDEQGEYRPSCGW